MQSSDTSTAGNLFSRNRKTERKTEKISKPRLSTTQKWRQSDTSSEDASTDTDAFSSSEDVSKQEDSGVTEPRQTTEPEGVTSLASKNPENVSVADISRKKSNYVLVNRTPEIQSMRLALPILADESSIMEVISENDVAIICGATGCGKTTQIPQFLYEAGYTLNNYKIGITEPRRVAAISMSERVAEELNLTEGEVSYHIRYEKNVSSKTQIKFMTDGILLQEVKKSFELADYSAIIIDEAHERSIYTDVLLGLLSLIVRLRRRNFEDASKPDSPLPLKLIIMSATLRVGDFADNRQLFPPPRKPADALKPATGEGALEAARPGAPPVIQVESRQYPVTCHFSKITPDDYLKAAFRKVVALHRDSPPGGILVFLTGQREVKTLCSWLTHCFPPHSSAGDTVPVSVEKRTSTAKKRRARKKAEQEATEDSLTPKQAKVVALPTTESEEDEAMAAVAREKETVTPRSRFDLDNFDIIPADEESELGLRTGNSLSNRSRKVAPSTNDNPKGASAESVQSSSEDEEVDLEDALDAEILEQLGADRKSTPAAPIHALPLYSLLPAEQQKLVFEPPPDGHRLVVVATNVAETSLTIPNIRFVVDTGKVKSKVYDPVTGASCFKIVWVSQASAEQRAGRAGRIGPGHCYRLFSSRVFTDMEPHGLPDILTRPIDEVVLLLKSYLGTIPLSRFPLPTAPSPTVVEAAERRLIALEALEEKHVNSEPVRVITRAGRWMARLPLPVRLARMLLFANQHDLMPYAVILVAALSVSDFFLPEPVEEQQNEAEEESQENRNMVDAKRRRRQKTEAERIMDQRTTFQQQFVKTQGDLLLGDLAVLLGSVCCLERYWAQLAGILPMEDTRLGHLVSTNRVARLNPESTMRQLAQNCGIRWKAYVEIRQLRRQLTDILNANVPDLNLTVDPSLPKPTPAQVESLRQLFLVGSACHLATKFDVPVEGLPTKDRRRLRYAYKVPGFSGPVYIDPASPLARENCSFVAYAELHTSAKPFLRYVCAIAPCWIPFLTPQSYRVEGLSVMEPTAVDAPTQPRPPPAEEEQKEEVDEDGDEKPKPASAPTTAASLSPPHYDPQQDVVVAFAKRVYFVGADLVSTSTTSAVGDLESSFELPAHHVPVPLNGSPAVSVLGAHESLVWSVRWFARALLEGAVFPSLKEWLPRRLKSSTPTRMMTLSWGLVRTEVRGVVSKLLAKKVSSRRALEACLQEDPQFLLKELTPWIQDEHRSSFQTKWPPLLSK
uniref:RNA helicase n=1 Tax=Schistocephalus solidus TaxID=70667 RepID=A0A0X3QAR2_SCHSO